MSLKQKEIFKQAVEIIIDGVAISHEAESRAHAGLYMLNLLIANNADLLDKETIKAIKSLVEMADEADSPMFNL